MNRAQTCRFLGWKNAEFDAAVARGFPAAKPDPSRGRDWRIRSEEAVAWVAQQEVSKTLPQSVDQDEPPPKTPAGLEAVDQLQNPFDQGALVAHLTAIYSLPAQVAVFTVLEAGLPMDTAFRLSTGVTAMVMHGFAAELGGALEPWRSSEQPDIYRIEGFDVVNWPALAAQAGEPEWTPPRYGFGWVEDVAAPADARTLSRAPAGHVGRRRARGLVR